MPGDASRHGPTSPTEEATPVFAAPPRRQEEATPPQIAQFGRADDDAHSFTEIAIEI